MNPSEPKLKPGEVRVRIAPAPTGKPHMGSARTALFNYLFAKKHKGSFVLRIEDTDKERSKAEYEEKIIEGLKWLGINWNEGPDIGGAYGPYRQSDRLKIYEKYLKKLLDEGKAYYCFCTKEELDAHKQYQQSRGEAPKYSKKCADLSKDTVKNNLAEGKPCVIRFRTPSVKVEFEDLIRGHLEFDASLAGDFVIAKNLSMPLYNFAVVVDDFSMKISHVIRGEDLLPNTPKHILLQEALGFSQPKFAHLPVLLGPNRAKLSKRHGAMSVPEYKELGYLPEAIINFLALLGWNPGTDREFFAMPDLIEEFSLEKIQKAGAFFNVQKLDFFNSYYIRRKTPNELTELCLPYLINAKLIKKTGGKYETVTTGEGIELETIQKVISLYKERLRTLSEISDLTDFFFKDKLAYEKSLLKWKDMTDNEIGLSLDRLLKLLSKIEDKNWTKNNLENEIMPEAEKFSQEIGRKAGDRGYILWPMRIALTGKKASAGPFEIAEALGKEKTVRRIGEAIKLIS